MNTVYFDGDETCAVVGGESFFFGRTGGVWYVGRDGWFEMFDCGRVAASIFRQVVEVALLEDEERRRMEPEPPFILGRVELEAADELPY